MITNEVWRTHHADARYEVSNLGRIRDGKRMVPVFVFRKSLNYFRARGQGRLYRVDVSVAMAFLPPPVGWHILHLDKNLLNDNVLNLQWVDTKGPYTSKGFTSGTKRPVRNLDTGETFPSIKDAAKRCNISGPNICHALRGMTYTAGGFRWRYADE